MDYWTAYRVFKLSGFIFVPFFLIFYFISWGEWFIYLCTISWSWKHNHDVRRDFSCVIV